MRKFRYNLKNRETGKVVEENKVAELSNEWTEQAVAFFLGGLENNAVNVKEIK